MALACGGASAQGLLLGIGRPRWQGQLLASSEVPRVVGFGSKSSSKCSRGTNVGARKASSGLAGLSNLALHWQRGGDSSLRTLAYGRPSSRMIKGSQTAVAKARPEEQAAEQGGASEDQLAVGQGSDAGKSQRKSIPRKSTSAAHFAAISTSTQDAPPPLAPSSNRGSPVLWVGVGVGLALVLSRVASYLGNRMQRFAMQQAMAQISKGAAPGAATPGTSAFPFSPPSPTAPFTGSTATKAQAVASPEVKEEQKEKKKSAFFQDTEVVNEPSSTYTWADHVAKGGGAEAGKGLGITIDQLDQMLENPKMQEMIFPYLPEEMRNPETLTWMMKNPQYRKQMEETLKTMTLDGAGAVEGQLGELLKQYDLSNPVVQAQFDAMGMTPAEVVQKMMAHPDVAMAFQKPKVQAALLDCAKNPMNQIKYMNDPEVMDVFNKLNDIFANVPGAV